MLALYHLFSGHRARRAAGIERVLAEAGVDDARRRPGGRCWSATRSRPASRTRRPTARWCARSGASWPGSSAGRRATRSSPRPTRRRRTPGDALRRAVQRVRAVPDPDRRVGRLCPPALRPERPARRVASRRSSPSPRRSPRRRSASKNCLLVISLPASDRESPHAQADDVEVGGEAGARRWTGCRTSSAGWNRRGGRRAPRRASRSSAGGCSSRSPSPTSSRDRDAVVARLRRPLPDAAPGVPARVPRGRLRASASRPPTRSTRSCSTGSTTTGRRLEKFQRTRGVLRLMAAVIHSLWEQGRRATC